MSHDANLRLTLPGARGEEAEGRGERCLNIHGPTPSLHNRVPLPESGDVIIGSNSDEVTLPIDHPTVSRLHLRLYCSADQILAEDVGSRYGTKLNGQPLLGRRALRDRDCLQVGDIYLYLHISHRAPSSPELRATEDLHKCLHSEVERAQHDRVGLGVILLDVSDAGDEALARVLRRLRPIDVPFLDRRYGLVILVPRPEQDDIDVAALAQGLLRALDGLYPDEPQGRGAFLLYPDSGASAQGGLDLLHACLHRSRRGEVLDAGAGLAGLEEDLHIGGRRVVLRAPKMCELHHDARRLAPLRDPVLIMGETGTGKEIIARLLHEAAPERRREPFVALNCAQPETLFHNEMFGHEKGAFDGAHRRYLGAFEQAGRGTLFLDEIGELAPPQQAALLRVLSEGELRRLGGDRTVTVECRVVMATHRDLEAKVADGSFRRDMWTRISKHVLSLPPLRERPEEIPALARHFLGRACQLAGRPPMEISPGALHVLCTYHWPGNIRELDNVMSNLLRKEVCSVEPSDLPRALLQGEAPPPPGAAPPPAGLTLPEAIERLERTMVKDAIEGRTREEAARILGVSLRTLQGLIKRYGLSPRVRGGKK